MLNLWQAKQKTQIPQANLYDKLQREGGILQAYGSHRV